VQVLPLHPPKRVENEPDVIFRERCLGSLLDDFEECYKHQETLQRAEEEARQRCENETKVLKQKAEKLDNTLRKETERRGTLLREALLATQMNAAARTKQIQSEVSAVVAQADLDIAKTRMELPGRQWSEELMAARYHALNGSAVQDAQSRYLDAYEGAIRENEASLMAENMELVALHLSWSTKRVTPTRSCKYRLDEKWTHRINLRRLRAAPARSAYEASKASYRDDLQTHYATAANELSIRRKDRFKKGAELDIKVQKLVDAIAHQRDKELVKLQANITEIEERRHWQAEKLRAEYKTQLSGLKSSMQPLVESLLSAIKKRQKVFDREQDIIAKDLQAVQATLNLMTSAIQTLGQDLNTFPDKHTQPPPSNQDGSGACPCGCGRRGPSRFARSSDPRFSTLFNSHPRQRTYEKVETQQRADESRRQREVDKDKLLRHEERSRRKREEQRSREAARAQARAEREARIHLRKQAKRRREEETRERVEETRRRRDEERRRAEANRRTREEEERNKREEEEIRKRGEEEKRCREDARRREEEERRRAEAHRRAREEEERKQREEEETRKRAEEEERRREDARRHEEEERRRAEADRRAREEEEESRKRAEEDERRREDDRRREEEESGRREEGRRREGENQQDRQEQHHSNDNGGENAQGATDEDEIEDDDRSGGTRGPSTANGRTKFVRKCWNKYMEAWRMLMGSGVSRLRFQEIPWPVLPPRKRHFTRMSIAAILSRISKESIRTFILDPEHLQSTSPKVRIRKELLRFHPDKRAQWLKNVKDEEKEQVDEACEQVVHHLTDLLNTAA